MVYIFTYIYHTKSTIHVGEYSMFPWILWDPGLLGPC